MGRCKIPIFMSRVACCQFQGSHYDYIPLLFGMRTFDSYALLLI